MYSRIEIKDNFFKLLVSKPERYPIWIRCTDIQEGVFLLPRYLDDKLRKDLMITLNKICDVLSGRENIKVLKYKKYESIYKSIENQLGGI